MGSISEKNRGKKSRDTAHLKALLRRLIKSESTDILGKKVKKRYLTTISCHMTNSLCPLRAPLQFAKLTDPL